MLRSDFSQQDSCPSYNVQHHLKNKSNILIFQYIISLYNLVTLYPLLCDIFELPVIYVTTCLLYQAVSVHTNFSISNIYPHCILWLWIHHSYRVISINMLNGFADVYPPILWFYLNCILLFASRIMLSIPDSCEKIHNKRVVDSVLIPNANGTILQKAIRWRIQTHESSSSEENE